MKFLLENSSTYYLIEIVRVDNNRLIKNWKFDDEDDAWSFYDSIKAEAQEHANYLNTLVELSITVMDPMHEEELASEYFDYDE